MSNEIRNIMKDLKPVYSRLRDLKHDCQVNNVLQATIDMVENVTDRLMYAEECERLEDVIGLIHYDVSTILEMVEKRLPDYKIIKELEQLFDIDFNMNEEIIYFSVNNWFCGRDYPPTENFKKWLGNDLKQAFSNDEWAKENKLCIYHGIIDMSQNYTIAAPRSWVEKNCPELLTDDEYTYIVRRSDPKESVKQGKTVWVDVEQKGKYSDFVDKPDENGYLRDSFGWPYLEYKEENFGCHWYSEYEDYEDEEELEQD